MLGISGFALACRVWSTIDIHGGMLDYIDGAVHLGLKGLVVQDQQVSGTLSTTLMFINYQHNHHVCCSSR